MNLPEINRINAQLEDYFGREDNKPRWRVVWSGDQLETRWGDFEDRKSNGELIRAVSEWRQIPKYNQYINPPVWILERLLEMPSFEIKFASKLSYECLWAFNPEQIPRWGAVKLLVDTVNQNMEQHYIGAKYPDPDSTPESAMENKEDRIKIIEEELFGNETEMGDALAYRQGVGFNTSKVLGGQQKES